MFGDEVQSDSRQLGALLSDSYSSDVPEIEYPQAAGTGIPPVSGPSTSSSGGEGGSDLEGIASIISLIALL